MNVVIMRVEIENKEPILFRRGRRGLQKCSEHLFLQFEDEEEEVRKRIIIIEC